MTFDEFIAAAWKDHGDTPAAVAERLEKSLQLVQRPEHIAPIARLAVHVHGEHLGDWQRGLAFLDALKRAAGFDGSAAVAATLARHDATLHFAIGNDAALAALPVDDRIAALATAAPMFAGREDWKRAIATYADAIALARAQPPAAASPSLRAIAVAGNNLAAALEMRKDRDAEETHGMVMAARGGLDYWKLAGTWLEEERAEYRLARSLLQANDATQAAQAAQRCADLCLRHDAPPFERFFAYAALAVAQHAAGEPRASADARALALDAHAEVPADEQGWCASDYAELRALAP